MKSTSNREFSLSLFVLFIICISSFKSEAALTYILSGVGSGSLGSIGFSDSAFTITATEDPADVMQVRSNLFRLEPVTAVIDILGVGSAIIDIPANLAANQGTTSVGIGDPVQGKALFFVSSPELASYDLRTPLDTVIGQPTFSDGLNFPTTAGAFSLVSASRASFQAVPEPSSLYLMISAAVLSLTKRSRTRRASQQAARCESKDC